MDAPAWSKSREEGFRFAHLPACAQEVLVTPGSRRRRGCAALKRQAHFGAFRAPRLSEKHILVQEPKRRLQIWISSKMCTALKRYAQF